MRGRQREIINNTYKRASSKDRLSAQDREDGLGGNDIGKGSGNPPWIRSLPHVIVAALSSFLFGYHLGVVNDTLESISVDLGFHGDTMAEGLVVSTCLGGAFFGSTISGWIADGIGRRRSFQLCAIPMIIGASMRSMENVDQNCLMTAYVPFSFQSGKLATADGLGGMLLGRFLVGTAMGVSPPVAALYITEVSPAFVRGTYGSFSQIATCLGLICSFFIGIPAKDVSRWWRVCFWVSTVPAALLALLMEFCAESPHWLFKRGRSADAEAEFAKLLGGLHVKSSMAELSKTDRGDEVDGVKLSELFYGRHSRVVFIGSALLALQQFSGINAVFYFSSTVFKSAGVPPDIANMSVGVVNLSGSIVAMLLMDKLGRKALLLGSFMGMAMSMGMQAVAGSSLVSGSPVVYLSVGGVLLFVLSFAMGVGPVPGLYCHSYKFLCWFAVFADAGASWATYTIHSFRKLLLVVEFCFSPGFNLSPFGARYAYQWKEFLRNILEEGYYGQRVYVPPVMEHAPHSTSREYTLKTQLLRIEMHGDKTPNAYLNRAQEYADALATIGEPVKDKDRFMLAVSGLRKEYNGLKTTITAWRFKTSWVQTTWSWC
ncbi:probable plastidic glucose transporter 3 [Tanacetum coccineum]